MWEWVGVVKGEFSLTLTLRPFDRLRRAKLRGGSNPLRSAEAQGRGYEQLIGIESELFWDDTLDGTGASETEIEG